jgi:hypothetical protein
VGDQNRVANVALAAAVNVAIVVVADVLECIENLCLSTGLHELSVVVEAKCLRLS